MKATLPYLILLLGILLGETPQKVAGGSLRCYTCVSMDNDRTCLEDPESVTSSTSFTDCEMEGEVCCTINRIDYLEDKNKLQSFGRSCSNDCPSKSFTEQTDSTYIVYTTACTTPLCNVGPGDEPLKNVGGPNNAKDNEIWGIQGIRSGTAPLVTSFTSLLLPLLLILLCRN